MSPAHLEDRAAVAAVVETFFAAFTSGPEAEVDARLDALRATFLPGAVVVRTCGDLTAYDVESFIAPRRRILTDCTLTGFREWEVEGRTDLFGDLAQHWCTYAKEGVQGGAAFTGRGSKSVQLVRTPDGWRISAVAWDDERA